MPETTESHPTGRWFRLRDAGLGLLVGLVIGGLVAGFVYVDGREQLAALDARREAQAIEVDRSVQSIRDQLEAARSFDALLRARIAADVALAELERSNFGLSREQLRYVQLALEEVDPGRIGVDPPALFAARQLVDNTVVEVAPDLEAQRVQLENVVRTLDALIPRRQRG